MTDNQEDQPIGEGESIPPNAVGHEVGPNGFESLNDRVPSANGNRPSREVRTRYRSKAGIISGYALVFALTMIVVTFLWQRTEGDQMPVLVLKDDVPAYRLLTEDDVTLSMAPTAEKNHYASLPVKGRLTLKAVKKNEPLTRADLSPDVTKALGSALIVTGISVPHSGGLNGTLQPGDHILLMLTGKSGKHAELDVFVLSATSGGTDKRTSLVIALRRKDAEKHAAAFLEGKILVLKQVSSA